MCGQENLEPKESFGHLLSHFVNDVTHFDGKFFTTLKDLIIRPGFLSRQYMKGKKVSYLNPIRMYIFTSAIFFLLFFSFFHDEKSSIIQTSVNGHTLDAIAEMDSTSFAEFTSAINEGDNKPAVPMTRAEFKSYIDRVTKSASPALFASHKYYTKEAYDSALKSGRENNNWFERKMQYKSIELRQKYGNNGGALSKALSDTFYHFLPQMLIISLPLLALILKLVYIRRKQFYYVSHLIFSVHLYIFIFINVLLLLLFQKANNYAHSGILSFIAGLLYVGIFVYEYLALKNFYQQGWGKTFLKFLIINILNIILTAVLLGILIFFSFFKI